MDSLNNALESVRPSLVSEYTTFVTNMFNDMVENLGPTLKGVYNHPAFARTYSNTVARCVVSEGDHKRLDDTRLADAADAYASATIERWKDKIAGKLVELDHAKVIAVDGCSFTVNGEREGKAVSIRQGRVLKVSSKGTFYNQYPARIYVNGKFTSEAKYKRMF